MTHSAQYTAATPDRVVAIRTCAGCGKRAPRSDLVRIVAAREGVTVVDPQAIRPGRGAWIHPDPHCVDRARTRRALVRALRLQEPPPREFWDALAQVVSTRTSADVRSRVTKAGWKPMGTR